jgi:alkanesulfonate monooxygenase SsuD/methylene tetrahydromethanopterin reductase-like flavin-dependent oxidoreductase (luciferase family)
MICLMVEGQEGIAADQWLALADACERAGLEGLFTSDHYGSVFDAPDRAALDVWGVLCALAGRTTRLRLGTMVSPVTYRLPSVVTKLAVTADHLSGGRIELGLGAGWHEREHAAFGFPFPPLGERIGMLGEQCEIVTRLMAGEELTFEGNHYRLDRCRLVPAPLQSPLPVILGGSALPRTAALAARFATEYNMVDAGPEDCAAARGRLDEACAAVGRDPATLRMSVMTRCVVGRDQADYERRLAAMCRATGEDPAALQAEERATWIDGPPDELRAKVGAFRAAGVERFFLQHLDHADVEAVAIIGEVLA